MGILFRQVLPPSAAAQNPQNPFQHTTALDPRATALAVFGRFREQGRDCASVSNGPDRAIGPPSALLASVIPHFPKPNHCHFKSLSRVVQQLLVELVYFEAFGDIRAAIAREKQIKGWLRARKIALIEAFNPRWKDF